MARKITEKMLFEVWLDIKYALEDLEQRVSDIKIDLTDNKRRVTKTKKLLTQAEKHYEEVNGKLPKQLCK